MGGTTAERGALAEVGFFYVISKTWRIPRQQAKANCPLEEILLLCMPAVLAGTENHHRHRRVRP